MINKIIDGICEALHREFGSEYEIYTEEIKQGLKEPCFSVVILAPATTQYFGRRYYNTNPFCIHYFPKSQTAAKAECYDVIERLTNCLEYITVSGDPVRGTGMNSEIVEGVLSFFVNYNMFVLKDSEEQTSMEELAQKTDLKE